MTDRSWCFSHPSSGQAAAVESQTDQIPFIFDLVESAQPEADKAQGTFDDANGGLDGDAPCGIATPASRRLQPGAKFQPLGFALTSPTTPGDLSPSGSINDRWRTQHLGPKLFFHGDDLPDVFITGIHQHMFGPRLRCGLRLEWSMGWSCWLSLVSRTTSAATIKPKPSVLTTQLGIITLDIALFGRRRQGAVRVSGIKGVSPPGCWSYSPRFIPREDVPGLGLPVPHIGFGPAFPVRPWRPATGSGVLAHQPRRRQSLAIFPLLIGGSAAASSSPACSSSRASSVSTCS